MNIPVDKWLVIVAVALSWSGCSGPSVEVGKDEGVADGTVDTAVVDVIIKYDNVAPDLPGDGLEIPDGAGDEVWLLCQEEGGFGCVCEADEDTEIEVGEVIGYLEEIEKK